MDRHLCLDFKTGGQYRECLDELIAEGTIAGHDIPYIAVKQTVDTSTDQAVTEVMERALVLCEICGGQTVSHHHIRIVTKYLLHHLRCRIHRIGIVSVHHDIALCIHLTEHPADDIALSLHIFISHNGTGTLCNFRCPV